MRIACLKNHPVEGPAAVGEWAAERGFSLEVFEGFNGAFPKAEDWDALLIMGGSMSVNDADKDAFVAAAIDTVSAFLESDRHVLGVCLGAQMLAVAAGGEVTEGPEKEIGWYPISIHPEPRDHLLSDVVDGAVVFHWHGDQIALPPQATLLASTPVCQVQAFQLGAHQLGLQCHFEVTKESMEQMLAAFASEVRTGGVGVQTAEEMRLGFSRFGSTCRDSLLRILDRWSCEHSG